MAVLHLKEADFDQTIAQGVTLVDFWADWCGPCKMLAPVIDALAARYAGKAQVAKVNIDEEMGLATRFGIMSIPTLLLFRDGKLEQQTVGVQPEDALAHLLDAALGA
ncbi:MAG: thioredoxin [Oscillospiraceae bacterium]|nr:thioredoxin [Oscillospiraceae bacterium]